MKNKKHDKIVNDYENQKRKELEKIATKSLATQEKFRILKDKEIKTDFFKLF